MVTMEEAVRCLTAAGVEEPRAKAEFALAHILRCGRAEAVLRRAPLSSDEGMRFRCVVDRLAHHEPLQYVLGDTEFLGRSFVCDRRALIPRPETEQLVERVLTVLATRMQSPPRVADVGTGTGCIAISMILNWPGLHAVAIDSSADALALARENAERWGVTNCIEFRREDLLTGISPRSFDAVISNPPYVATSVWETLSCQVRSFEPRLALDGGSDGLNLIRKLAVQAWDAVKPGGGLFIELGEDQGAAVAGILDAAGWKCVAISKDGFGLTRFAQAFRPD